MFLLSDRFQHQRTAKAFTKFAALLAFTIFTACLGWSQDWSASTGTPDPTGASLIHFNGATAAIAPHAPVGTSVKLRYNIVLAGNLLQNTNDLTPGECRQLVVRFLDNGAGAHVTLALRQHNLVTGAVTTLLTFDSNSAPSAAGYQMSTSPCGVFNFRFADQALNATVDSSFLNVYYIEATLTRTAAGGNAGLAGFALQRITP